MSVHSCASKIMPTYAVIGAKGKTSVSCHLRISSFIQMARNVKSHLQLQSHDFNISSAATSSTNPRDDGLSSGQDKLLPIANVGRIMKQVLPPNAKISKDAKETMQECASEFIGFITGEASHRCRMERRKTINGDDVCVAMKIFGLDEYADTTFRYLQKYREQGEKASSTKQDRSIKIDVQDELSISRSPNPQDGKQSERAKRYT